MILIDRISSFGHIALVNNKMIRPSPRRGRLLDAARRLFASWGFDKTSVDEIALEAGVSKGAVYLEFSGKDELFKALLRRELARYSQDWLRRFQQDPGEWSFARMFQHSIAAVNANPFMKGLLTRDRRIYGNYLRRDTEFFEQAISIRTEFFLQLQDAGALRKDIPAAVLAQLLSGIGYGLITSEEVLPKNNQAPFDEMVTALGFLLDRGLAPEKGYNRKAARDLIVRMVEKMEAALSGGGDSGPPPQT